MPFEWLSKSFSKKSIKTRWTRALAKTGIYPICHCKDKPWHVPPNCPLLKELHLKLEVILSGPAVQPAVQQSPDAPMPSPPSHGGRALGVDSLWVVVPLALAMLPLVCWHQCLALCLELL
jgi:hypothetical protein